MYYFNILEPRFICDRAIKALKREQTRISIEIGKVQADKQGDSLENYMKIQELKKLQYDYYRLIQDLEQLGSFGVQQMEQMAKNGDRRGNCIF